MDIVRTALSGQAATSFFSEFLGNGQSTLAEFFEWETFEEAENAESGFERTSEDAPDDRRAEEQAASLHGSEQAR